MKLINLFMIFLLTLSQGISAAFGVPDPKDFEKVQEKLEADEEAAFNQQLQTNKTLQKYVEVAEQDARREFPNFEIFENLHEEAASQDLDEGMIMRAVLLGQERGLKSIAQETSEKKDEKTSKK